MSQVNPRKMFGPLDSSSMDDEMAGIDPKNFATIRTTSIVQRQQKEHLQEEMHEQMSGDKRMRRDHQAALARLEDNCRQEMEKHKNLLDREYEQLLTQFSKDLERLQVKHQEELAKTVRHLICAHIQEIDEHINWVGGCRHCAAYKFPISVVIV